MSRAAWSSYTPANYGLVEHGPVLIREALASSYNIPAVVTLDHIGLDALVSLTTRLGISTLTDTSRLDLSLTLGGGEVRLLELTAAYGALANGGYRVDPVYILEVRDKDGHVLYEWQQPQYETPVIDPRVAFLITDILSDNEARIPSFGPGSPLNIGRPAAAKTGTTTNFRDNWTMGYTPESGRGRVGRKRRQFAHDRGQRDQRRGADLERVYAARAARPAGTGICGARWAGARGSVRHIRAAADAPMPQNALGMVYRWHRAHRVRYVVPAYSFWTIGPACWRMTPRRAEDREERVYLVLPPEARDWAITPGDTAAAHRRADRRRRRHPGAVIVARPLYDLPTHAAAARRFAAHPVDGGRPHQYDPCDLLAGW